MLFIVSDMLVMVGGGGYGSDEFFQFYFSEFAS